MPRFLYGGQEYRKRKAHKAVIFSSRFTIILLKWARVSLLLGKRNKSLKINGSEKMPWHRVSTGAPVHSNKNQTQLKNLRSREKDSTTTRVLLTLLSFSSRFLHAFQQNRAQSRLLYLLNIRINNRLKRRKKWPSLLIYSSWTEIDDKKLPLFASNPLKRILRTLAHSRWKHLLNHYKNKQWA